MLDCPPFNGFVAFTLGSGVKVSLVCFRFLGKVEEHFLDAGVEVGSRAERLDDRASSIGEDATSSVSDRLSTVDGVDRNELDDNIPVGDGSSGDRKSNSCGVGVSE